MKKLYFAVIAVFSALILCGFMGINTIKAVKIDCAPLQDDATNAKKVLPVEKQKTKYIYKVIVPFGFNYKGYLKIYPDDAIIASGSKGDVAYRIYTNNPYRVSNYVGKRLEH